jgi:hypothetical protein
MSLAGCHFDADPNNTGVASSASATGSGSGSAAAGVALHWEMPTENTNGTPLTDLQGYTIVYGESPGTMNKWVQISDIGTTNYVLSGLSPGIWYFAVLSYTSSGANSALSNVVSKTIS